MLGALSGAAGASRGQEAPGSWGALWLPMSRACQPCHRVRTPPILSHGRCADKACRGWSWKEARCSEPWLSDCRRKARRECTRRVCPRDPDTVGGQGAAQEPAACDPNLPASALRTRLWGLLPSWTADDGSLCRHVQSGLSGDSFLCGLEIAKLRGWRPAKRNPSPLG